MTNSKPVMVSLEMAEELLRGPRVCGWKGCDATYEGDQPEGWMTLMAYHAPRPVTDFMKMASLLQIDTQLCPKHVEELQGFLALLNPRMNEPPQGEG